MMAAVVRPSLLLARCVPDIHVVGFPRRVSGFPCWSLSGFLKHRVKNAVPFIADFENALAREAR